MSDAYKAVLRHIRVAPRKARLVADLVRGKSAADALDILKVCNKKSAGIMIKLINSAIANATHTATVDVDRLVLSEIYVDDGATWKRFIPRAQGRATTIRKRTSHITVKVQEL